MNTKGTEETNEERTVETPFHRRRINLLRKPRAMQGRVAGRLVSRHSSLGLILSVPP